MDALSRLPLPLIHCNTTKLRSRKILNIGERESRDFFFELEGETVIVGAVCLSFLMHAVGR